MPGKRNEPRTETRTRTKLGSLATRAASAPKRARRHSAEQPLSPIDAVSLLRADHTKLCALLTGLRSAIPGRRQSLLAQVKRELQAHPSADEEVFHPAFGGAARAKRNRQLHAEEEEDELFPRVCELLSKDDIHRLGAQMKERLRVLLNGNAL
jgi:hemerythrin superfamily protein